MYENYVVTINRQFGSGGRRIGKRLSEALGIHYMDKELLALAAQKSGISEKLFEHADEKPTNSLLYSLSAAAYGGYAVPLSFKDVLTNDKLFAIQAEVIRSTAKERSCVMIGRCADDILSDHPHHLNVFIHAPLPVRVKTVAERHGLSEKAAEELILKTDKRRASYYNFYTSRKWDSSLHYDLTIDSSLLGEEGTAEYLKQLVLLVFDK